MRKKTYQSIIQKSLERLSRGEKVSFSNSLIKKAHAADVADIIANLSDDKQLNVFQNLDDERIGDVFTELPEDIQEDLVNEIDAEHLVALFKDLPPDEAVDMLNMVEDLDRETLLSTLPQNQQWDLRKLLLYREETAGGIMTPLLLSAQDGQTASEVIEILREHRDEDDVFLNIFVVNKAKKLIGVVPLQTLVLAKPETKITDIMEPDPIAVSVNDDQEVVAQLVSKYNLLVVPVVDENEFLVGRVTLDDVVEVLQNEAHEDVYLMAGMDADEVKVSSALEVARMRLPWLLTCLIGSFISAKVINSYLDTTLKTVSKLVIFLPAICAMGGNSGLQTSTVTIRNLSLGRVFFSNIRKIVKRELLSGMIIGLVCGSVVACVGGLWLEGVVFGVIIGISMLFTVMISTCTGFLFPIILQKMGVDPAVASGPMITTLNDATSSLTYLSMATFLLYFFHILK